MEASASTAADPLVGRLLDGRYRLDAALARGGMATVYTATDTRLDREVAVKVMHRALADDPEFVARFTREARAAARLSSAEVVAVFDQGTDAQTGLAFLVMEHVRGGTLRDLLRSQGAQSPARAAALLEPVLRALAAAHAGGLVHRDVKPENVLLGDDGRIKVADFGLARAVEASSLTATTVMMGTAAYMSPEQVDGSLSPDGAPDPRSDVYAAGIVLFELLTGAPPYGGDSSVRVAYRHVHEDVPAPGTLVDGVPAGARRPGGGAPPAATPGCGRPTPAPSCARCTRSRATCRPYPGRCPGCPPRPPTRPCSCPVRRPDCRGTAPSSGTPWPRWPRVWSPSPPSCRCSAAGTSAAAARPCPASSARPPTPRPSGSRRPASRCAPGSRCSARRSRPGRWPTSPPTRARTPAPAAPSRCAVSRGPDRRALPALVGLAQEAATERITRAGLRVGRVTRAFSPAPAGDVVAVGAPAGTRLRPGSPVNLTVSKGVELLDVPGAVGRTQAEAGRLLERAGFRTRVQEVFSETVARGTVVAQDPPGGRLPRGGRVTLQVSKGPERIAVPDLDRPDRRRGRRRCSPRPASRDGACGLRCSAATGSAGRTPRPVPG